LETQRQEEKAAPITKATQTSKCAPTTTVADDTATVGVRRLTFKEQPTGSLGIADRGGRAAANRNCGSADFKTRLMASLVHDLYQEQESLTAQLEKDLNRWAELA